MPAPGSRRKAARQPTMSTRRGFWSSRVRRRSHSRSLLLVRRCRPGVEPGEGSGARSLRGSRTHCAGLPPGEPRHGSGNVVRPAIADCSNQSVSRRRTDGASARSHRPRTPAPQRSCPVPFQCGATWRGTRGNRSQWRAGRRTPGARERESASIVSWIGGRQSLRDEVRGVRENGVHPLGLEVPLLSYAQPKPPPKRRSR